MILNIFAETGAAVRRARLLRFLDITQKKRCLPDLRRVLIRFLVQLALIFSLASSLSGCTGESTEPVLEPYRAENASKDASEDPSKDAAEDAREDPSRNDAKSAREDSSRGAAEGAREDASKEAVKGPSKDALEAGGQESTARPALQSPGPDPEGLQRAEESRDLTVHVCGAVRREGVYRLPEGSRIADAVQAAGGFSEDADTDYLNLAMEIADGWQICVPDRNRAEALRARRDPASLYGPDPSGALGQTISSAADGPGTSDSGQEDPSSGTAGRINLNTATREELMQIPGIGESKARLILEYREKNGRFESIEDIMKVPGIKDASFQKLKDYITT